MSVLEVPTAPAMFGILIGELIFLLFLFWGWQAARAILLLALTGVIAVLLAGCATISPAVPPSLLTCSPQPKSPADNPAATDVDVGIYIIDLAEAGADCRSKLDAVNRLLSEE